MSSIGQKQTFRLMINLDDPNAAPSIHLDSQCRAPINVAINEDIR